MFIVLNLCVSVCSLIIKIKKKLKPSKMYILEEVNMYRQLYMFTSWDDFQRQQIKALSKMERMTSIEDNKFKKEWHLLKTILLSILSVPHCKLILIHVIFSENWLLENTDQQKLPPSVSQGFWFSYCISLYLIVSLVSFQINNVFRGWLLNLCG